MCPTQAWQDLLYPGDATEFFTPREKFPAFNPNATEYNRNNARWLAELCRLVYRHDEEESKPPPHPRRTDILMNAGFRQRKFFLSINTGTQAMLMEPTQSPTYAVLVFRGTEQTKSDFITDLKIWKDFVTSLDTRADTSNVGGVNVHRGFKEALDSVWNDIADELGKLDEKQPLFYTGHSLGAALATLAIARHNPQAVYTFGSPRVGNQAFADAITNTHVPIYRVVDDQDIVTTLPPELLGYRHVGIEQLLQEPPKAASFHDLFDPPKPLADHAPINYVGRV